MYLRSLVGPCFGASARHPAGAVAWIMEAQRDAAYAIAAALVAVGIFYAPAVAAPTDLTRHPGRAVARLGAHLDRGGNPGGGRTRMGSADVFRDPNGAPGALGYRRGSARTTCSTRQLTPP